MDKPVVSRAIRREHSAASRPEIIQVDEFNVRDLIERISRRKGLILGTVVAITAVTAVTLFLMTPRYSAEALIRIEPQNTNVLDLKSVMAGLASDTQAIESEIEVMKSRELAKRAIRRLQLDQAPEFNEALRPKSFVDKLSTPTDWLPASWRRAIFDVVPSEPASESSGANDDTKIVNEFLDRINVSVKGQSRVISIAATSEDAALSASMANTLANLYIDNQLEVNLDATKRASSGLKEQIARLKQTVDESEKAVEDYRKKAGLISVEDGVTLKARQLSELNTQLVVAHAEVEAKSARLSQVRDLVKAGKLDSLPEVLQSPLIQTLRGQEAEVQRRIAELSSEYGELHPTMINARAEARDLEKKINGEIQKIVAGLTNEVDVAKANERALQNSVDRLESRVADANTTSIKLRSLEREAAANRALLETFLNRVRETSAQEDVAIQQPEARIISFADVPIAPSFPRKKLTLALAVVVSVFVGLVLVFVVEQMDKGFRSSEQVASATGIPVFGLVPKVKRSTKSWLPSWMRSALNFLASGRIMRRLGLEVGLKKIAKPDSDPVSYILEKPMSSFGEAIRGFHASTILSSDEGIPKKILITSAQPNEGKTTLAISLARMLAKSGHNTVIVEGDLRRPAIHGKLNLPKQPGLTDFLSGDATLEEIIQKDEISGASVITSGKDAKNPSDLLGGDNMGELLDDLAENYDFVIVDTPPVMAVSDARILSTLADTTIFAIRWASTRREVVGTALRQLMTSGGYVAGAVLTLVDAKKHARYGYGDSGYFYAPIKKYYAE